MGRTDRRPTRAARAVPTRSSATAGRCAGSPPKRGASCSSSAPSTSARRSPSSRSATARSRSGADPAKSVTYAELVGGKRFDVTLTGRNVDATSGMADVKPVDELRIVGQPLQRYDIPAKVDGSLTWAVDMKLPGHGPCAQRQAAGRRRHAARHRRVVGRRRAGVRQGREPRQLRGRRLRARGAGHPRRTAVESRLGAAGRRAVPGIGRRCSTTSRRATPTSTSASDVTGRPGRGASQAPTE